MNQTVTAKFKKSPSFSFRGKFNHASPFHNPQNVPPPNKYKPQKLYLNQPKVVFPKSQRKTFLDRKLQKMPGPGQYELSKSIQMKYASTQSLRKMKTFSSRFFQKLQTKPGPGAYTIKNDFKKTLPTFSIGQKYKTSQQIQLQKNLFKPSPGAYQIQKNSINNSSIISIPKSPRMKIAQSTIPGPGKYDINQDLYSTKKSFGKRSFASSKRQISFQLKTHSPGPGNYKFESSFQSNKRKQKGFSCRKKFQSIIQSKQIPGPGQYNDNPNLKFRSISSCRLNPAQKKLLDNWKSPQSPGPGNYQNLNQSYSKLRFKSRSVTKFSKAKLQTLSPTKLNTTQKFYDANLRLVKKSSSSFSMGGQKKKSPFQKVPKLPGPGQYNPQTKLVTQTPLTSKFPQSARSSVILSKLKIGPGQYHNQQMHRTTTNIGTKFSKGKKTIDFSKIPMQNPLNKPGLKINSISNLHINSSLNKTLNWAQKK